ncbi:glycosyltransferase family 2 protein [Flavimarina sp. Hel_I_48]|uniref:glycosyltransferase family 2 protein n=1 Tax=Flavimarina sp. Hel_I_48 TaxID=1392488 RepID=UPI001F12B51A|nr:galactosyltransferase-related protein [Flavimarina sp. Hel_I_48]
MRNATMQPSEILIINMGSSLNLTGFDSLPIQILQSPISKSGYLPLARARNQGAEAAKYETLFFLDVDCIPSASYFDMMNGHLEANTGLIMGTPKYLMQPVQDGFNEKSLNDSSINHPYRPVVEGCALSTDPGLFWSLCFAIRKSLFNEIGGFDEKYSGYGAEDTDLSFSIRDKEYDFFISDAIVYHQQHAVHSPPFDKFDQIVENSKVFYKKWGIWPMGHWLQSFSEYNLIDWAPHYKKIDVLKAPSDEHIKSSYKPKAPFV